jgi:hypothetical protein
VVSEYEDGGKDYLGVFGNFLWLNKPVPVPVKPDSAKMDSAVKVDEVQIDTTIPPLPKGYTKIK